MQWRAAAVTWHCRLLLGIVLAHVALSSPVVRRDVLALADGSEGHGDLLAEIPPEALGEDVFGGDTSERGGRDKRLLLTKTLGVGALGVKAAKAVGAKVVATGAKAIGAKVLKVGAAAKAAAVGAVGIKAKAIGIKAATAVAAVGIKALIFKLLFGKINQLISHKERLLRQLDDYNKEQNVKWSQQLFGPPCQQNQPQPSGLGPSVAPVVPDFEAAGLPAGVAENFSPLPLPQLAKTSLLPRRHPSSSAGATVTAAPDTGDEDIPTFDPNRVSLQVPDELFAPAFNSVNSISTIFGNLIQKTAERIARLVESAKPLLRSSLGFGSKKRQASPTDPESNEPDEANELADIKDAETTYFTDSQPEVQEAAGSETSKQTTKADDAGNSIIKSSYSALSSS